MQAAVAQNIPAEEAIRAAMQALSAAQRPALELALEAAKAQAEIVHQLLFTSGSHKGISIGHELESLMAEAVERSPKVVNSLAAGLFDVLNSAAALGLTLGPAALNGSLMQETANTARRPKRSAQSQPPPDRANAAVGSEVAAPEAIDVSGAPLPEPEAPAMTDSQLMDAVLLAVAEGYSSGRRGSEVASGICLLYPDAIPVMSSYLAMDDFLVLLWLGQQPMTAEFVQQPDFASFYAEFKSAIVSYSDGSESREKSSPLE